MSLIETDIEPHTRRFTRDEYYAMADLGLFEGQRVELIEGEILEMAPQKNPHMMAIGLAQRVLARPFPDSGYWIRIQGPLNLGLRTEPEPDIAVVPGNPRDYQDHPTTALLIVEISETTLAFDRGRKSRLYAQAGIADYWIIDLLHRRLEVRRNPHQDASGLWSYDQPLILSPADSIAPLVAEQTPIPIADLLP